MRLSYLRVGILMLVAVIGCSVPDDATESGSKAASDGEETSSEEEGPFVLGDLLEPFKPPTLDELDAKVEWIDRPVLDAMELLRERQKKEGQPPLSVREALTLRNTSEENNTKILSALGRLPASDDEVDWNATINRHTRADVKSTNPIMVSSTVEFEVLDLTNFGLFSFDWNFRPFASKDTVKSWQVSKDRMYDKVVMRDDLVWSDGKPITAHDLVFSFKVIMSKRVPVPAMRAGTDRIRWIEAYDDYTLVYFHRESLATNIWNLNFAVIPKHIYEKSIREDPTLQDSEHHVKYEDNPVDGGPYQISSRVRGQEILLARRESYYLHEGKQVRDKPYFAKIRFRILPDPTVALLSLKKGEIDELELSQEQWKTQTTDDTFYKLNTKASGLQWLYYYFCWNCKTPFFSDPRVRAAMSYAFDYDEMLDKLLYGLCEPCAGIFHPTARWFPKDAAKPYKQDLDKAEALLDEAGWVDDDGDGIREKTIDGHKVKFEFRLLTFNIPERVAICNLLKENLDQIGVVCHVRPVEFTVLQDLTRKHKFHASFGGWGTGADPDTSDNIWGTDEGRNFGQYSNPQIDRLFKLGRKEFDPTKRAEIYGKIHSLLYQDQPYTWLYVRNAFYGFSKQLRGYNFSPRGPYSYGPGFDSIWKPKTK